MVELLDRVLQMQSEGLSESSVSQSLRNEGVSPLDIANALNQARVKSAVSDASSPVSGEVISGSSVPDLPPAPQENVSAPAPEPAVNVQEQPVSSQEQQQPVVADQVSQQQGYDQASQQGQGQYYDPSQQQGYSQQPGYDQQQYYDPSQQQSYDQASEQGYDQSSQQYADYYAQGSQGYDANAYYDPNGGYGSVDTALMSEVASQVFSDRFSDVVEKLGDVSSFRSSTEEKLKSLDRRLKKLEDSFDHLNRAVLGKVAEFGESSSLIHKDLDNLHDTVAKLMNPLADAFHEVKGHHSSKKRVSRKKKSVKKKK